MFDMMVKVQSLSVFLLTEYIKHANEIINAKPCEPCKTPKDPKKKFSNFLERFNALNCNNSVKIKSQIGNFVAQAA